MRRCWIFRTACIVFISTSAFAEERLVVRFAPRVPAPEAARLVSAIRAQLRDTASVELDSVETSAKCVVDVDQTDAGIVLRFTDNRGQSAGQERTIGRSGEIGASEAATIVRAFVVAAAEQAPDPTAEIEAPIAEPIVPPSEPPPSPPAKPPPAVERGAPPSAPPAPWSTRVGLMYTGATFAPELPWQSGARFEGAYAFLPGVYVGASYAFHPSSVIESDAATVRVTRHSGTAFTGIESRGRTWIVGADVAVGLDDAVRSTSRTTDGFSRTADAAKVAPVFALRFHGRWRIPEGRGLALDLAPTVELAPGQDRLVVEGRDTTTLLTPALTRLRVDIGATFDGF